MLVVNLLLLLEHLLLELLELKELMLLQLLRVEGRGRGRCGDGEVLCGHRVLMLREGRIVRWRRKR